MSSLWTPGGEVPVERGGSGAAPASRPADAPRGVADPSDVDLDQLSDAEREELAREIAGMQARLLSAPAADILASHMVQIANLAGLHLSQEHPNFADAALAIDAFGAVLDKLGARLGEGYQTLEEALGTLRMLFVQRRNEGAGDTEQGTAGAGAAEEAPAADPGDNPWS